MNDFSNALSLAPSETSVSAYSMAPLACFSYWLENTSIWDFISLLCEDCSCSFIYSSILMSASNWSNLVFGGAIFFFGGFSLFNWTSINFFGSVGALIDAIPFLAGSPISSSRSSISSSFSELWTYARLTGADLSAFARSFWSLSYFFSRRD